MNDYLKSKEQVIKETESSINGLNDAEVRKHTEKYGKNEIAEEKQKSIFFIFIEQFKDFLVIILIAAALVSAILGDIESTIVILAVITLNAILGTFKLLMQPNLWIA